MSSTIDFVAALKDAFPRQEVKSRTFEIYVEELSDIPLPTLGAVVKVLIRTSEFFPSIRAIREAAAEITLGLPNEDEALSQVERRIAVRGGDVHPDVKRALDHVGGYFVFKSTSEPSVVRGQFLRIYREIRADRIRAFQVGDFRSQLTAVS